MATARIGIFAGTFDPVHNGHIDLALAAITVCNLDKVIFLPEPTPRGKDNVTSLADRLAMLRLATKDQPHLEVLELQQPTFTVADTLPELTARFEGAQLVMIVGSDIAAHIHTWDGADTLLRTVELAVGYRHQAPPLTHIQATIVPTASARVAASHIRAGRSGAVPAPVAEYIKKRKLYRVH